MGRNHRLDRSGQWNKDSEDAAAIFGAIHRKEIVIDPADTGYKKIIDSWLKNHQGLRAKYQKDSSKKAQNAFRTNFGRNFRKVVERYREWKANRKKCCSHVIITLSIYSYHFCMIRFFSL